MKNTDEFEYFVYLCKVISVYDSLRMSIYDSL